MFIFLDFPPLLWYQLITAVHWYSSKIINFDGIDDGIKIYSLTDTIKSMKLTELGIRRLKPSEKMYRITDGDSLYMQIMPNGTKYWRMNYRFAGKQKCLAFGIYPAVSLKEARERKDQAKKILELGEDPSLAKKLKKLENSINHENSFENLAREWHKNKYHTWQTKHAENILKRLADYIFPSIGFRPIKAITPPEILLAIRPIENKGKHELAHRILQTISQIFRFAVATGRSERDVTQDLKGALKPVVSKNFAHLSEKELPAFVKDLEVYDTKFNGTLLTKLAFKFLLLTFVRSAEIRGARWEEINFEKSLWRIPAERMKMKYPHIVPLSKQSVEVLKEIYKISGEHFYGNIFPSQKEPKRVMSENTFLRAIKNMGYKGKTTGHGFRSTASTMLNEHGFRPDIIERQLAHAERDQVRAAYNHAEYLVERAQMMQWWGDYLDKIKS